MESIVAEVPDARPSRAGSTGSPADTFRRAAGGDRRCDAGAFSFSFSFLEPPAVEVPVGAAAAGAVDPAAGWWAAAAAAAAAAVFLLLGGAPTARGDAGRGGV